ncbi:MAG: DUF6240 domain-containing protein [Lachnospiraceae bacterium]|nr:DUF6240 domain-containing protein [Lachnospiraceae bacterium]
MQIQQILIGQENKIADNTSVSLDKKVEKPAENKGFFVPVAGKDQELMTPDKVATKAKSMTEGKTGSNAEYIAGVMNDSIYEEASKEGVDLSKEEEDVVVTVVDKIQMQMIEGGNCNVAATANLSDAALSEMTPGAKAAYDMASNLLTPTEPEISYLVENELEPTIGNFYQAQNVTAGAQPQKEMPVDPELLVQIQQRLTEFGIETTDEAINRGTVMVNFGVDLTPQNFEYFTKLENVTLPMPEEEVTVAIEEAVTVGRSASCAMVLPEYTWQNRAKEAQQIVDHATEEDLVKILLSGEDVTLESLKRAANEEETPKETQTVTHMELKVELKITKAKHTLEEARLYMSASANLSLLKRGIHIETEELENLVDDLKQKQASIEQKIYEKATPLEAKEADTLFKETSETLTEVKNAPAFFMASVKMEYTFTQVSTQIKNTVTDEVKADYVKANGAYETMQTEVRKDLGDNIQKAFRNVDDILEDMDLEVSESNQRAVRILAYNHTEITVENINTMKQTDEMVQGVFQKMTPKVVMAMIKDGYNPLDKPMAEVGAKASELKEKLDPAGAEKYSKFLVQMEKSGEITPEQKESFIGIYRLLRQVEKSDGAVVGAAVLAGAKVTMRNLMTQVRSMKTGKIDVKASDAIGVKDDSFVPDLSITEQVQASYKTEVLKNALEELSFPKLQEIQKNMGNLEELTPEQLLEALRSAKEEEAAENAETIKQMKEAYRLLDGSRELQNFFDRFDVKRNAENIMAVADYFTNKKSLYKKMLKYEGSGQETKDTLAEIKEELLKDVSEKVKTPKEMAQAQEALADLAEHAMDNMIEEEDVTSVDINAMKLLCKQFSILGSMAKKEEYAVPVLVADEMGTVSLKIVHGEKEKGKVTITTELESYGKIAAELSVSDKGISGYVVSDQTSTTELLAMQREELQESLQKAINDTDVTLNYVTSKDLSLDRFYQNSTGGEGSEQTQTTTAKLYSMAKVFIKTMSNIKETEVSSR